MSFESRIKISSIGYLTEDPSKKEVPTVNVNVKKYSNDIIVQKHLKKFHSMFKFIYIYN